MKKLTTYINEKANFIVKNHVKGEETFTDKSKLKPGDVLAYYGKYGKREDAGICEILTVEGDKVFFKWTWSFDYREAYTLQNTTLEYTYTTPNDEELKIAEVIKKFYETNEKTARKNK